MRHKIKTATCGEQVARRRRTLVFHCAILWAALGQTPGAHAGAACDPSREICFQGIGHLAGGIGPSSDALGVAHLNGEVVVVGLANGTCSGGVNCTKAVKFRRGPNEVLLSILNDVTNRRSNRATDVALVGTTTVVTGSVNTNIPPDPGCTRGCFSRTVINAYRAVQTGDETVEPSLLPNSGFLVGKAIADDGSVIVGNSSEDPFTSGAAFRWTLTGGTAVLPVSGAPLIVNDTSPSGKFTVGSNGSAWIFPDPAQPCLTPQQCALLIIGADTTTGVAPLTANGVTNGGVVVGRASLFSPNPNNGQVAFRWTPGFGSAPARLIELGWLDRANRFSEAMSVSGDGRSVVGGSRLAGVIGEPSPQAAFVWHEDLGLFNLRELAVADHESDDLTGWTLVQANAISTDGLAIAGSGLNPAGQTEGWFITLPDCNSNGRWDATEAPIPSARTTRTVLALDGVDDFAELAAPPSSLRITGDLTIEAWIYLHRLGVTQSLITLGGAAEDLANNALYAVEVNAAGDVVVTHERADLSDAVFTADTNLQPGRWYHLAVLRRAASPQTTEYAVQIDNLAPLSGNVGGPPAGGTAGTLRIGRGTGGASDRLLDGFLADVRVWNTVRTATQLHGSMFITEPVEPQGLVAAWAMDESSGTILADAVESNDLVVAGAAARLTVGADCNHNRIPDACDADCNGNGISDACEVIDGTSCDNDLNGRPDECDAPEVLAQLASQDSAATEVFRNERDDPISPTTFGTMIQNYGRPWKPGTGQTPGGGICLGGAGEGLICAGGSACPGGSCIPPPGTGATRDPAERLRTLTKDPSCIPVDLAQQALNELFAFEMLLGNEAFADAMDPTVGEGALGESISLEQVPGLFAFNGLPSIGTLLSEELALLRGREIALPLLADEPLNDDPPTNANGNYPQFGAATRASIYNRLRPNATGTFGSLAYRSNYGFTSTTDNATASEAFPQGHGDAYGYYLTATAEYLNAFGAAREEPVSPDFSQRMVESLRVPQSSPDCSDSDCESILDDDGIIHRVGFQSVRNMAAAMAARARTANRIVDLTFRQDYREDVDTPLTDSDIGRAWGIADWARRGGIGAYFDWALSNHLLPVPEPETADEIEAVHRQRVDEVRILASAVNEMQERVDAAGAGLNPLGLVPNVVPFRIIQPGQLLNFLEGGANSGKSHYGIVRDAAVEAIRNARGILKRANLGLNRLRTNEESFAEFEDRVRESDIGLNNRLIEIFGLPSPSDTLDNDFEDNDGDGAQITNGRNDPDDDAIEAGCNGECAGSPDLLNFLVDAQTLEELGLEPRAAAGQVQLAMFELRTAALRIQSAELAIANLEALIQDKAENVALTRNEALEQLEIQAQACDDRESVLGRKEKLAKLREERGTSSRFLGFFSAATACVVRGGLGDPTAPLSQSCESALGGSLGLVGDMLGNFQSGSSPFSEIEEQFDIEREELRINCWQTAQLTRISNDQTIRALEIELEDLIRRTPQAILELAVAETQTQQAFAVVQKSFQEGKRILDERDRIRRVQSDRLQDFRFRDLAFRTFRNQALEQYGAFFDLASRYVMLAARAFAYEYNERDEVDDQMRRLYRERLLGTETATDKGLESVIARLDQKRQESDFSSRLQKLSLFDQGGDEFSLRKNFLGLAIDPSQDTDQRQFEKNKAFRAFLESNIVQELLEVPAFSQLASFDSDRDAGPAIVLTFSTEVAGRTLFGKRRGTLFGAPANFDTCSNPKLFEFAILLEGVDNPSALGVDGPLIFAHLLPVGSSMLRAPETGDCALRTVRTWGVVDQRIPGVSAAYRDEGGAILDTFNIPRLATSEDLYLINRFPVTQAQLRQTENPVFQDELAGWSVWNTQWLLAIPGRQFADPADDPAEVRRKLLILIFDADQSGNPRSPEQNLGIDDVKLRIKAYGKPS